MFRVVIASLIAIVAVAFGPATPRALRAKVEMSMTNKVAIAFIQTLCPVMYTHIC